MKLQLVHTGLLVSSEKYANEFFEDLLGLTCSREYTVPADLMTELFGMSRELDVRIYDIGDQKLEVFISGERKGGADPRGGGTDRQEQSVGADRQEQSEGADRAGKSEETDRPGEEDGRMEKPGSPDHLCIRVDDREALIGKSLDLGFRVYERAREGKPNLVFFYDRDGNPYEIVQ